MSDTQQRGQSRPPVLRGLIERLTSIKLHSFFLRRKLQRGEVQDPATVAQHLDKIDQEVAEATELVRDELGTAKHA